MNHASLRDLPFSTTIELIEQAEIDVTDEVMVAERLYMPLYLNVLLAAQDIMKAGDSDGTAKPYSHIQISFDWPFVRELMLDERVGAERKKLLAHFIDDIDSYSIAFEDNEQPEHFYEEWNARAQQCVKMMNAQINKLVKF